MITKNHIKPIFFDSIKRIDFLGFFILILGLILFVIAAFSYWQNSRLLEKANSDITFYQNSTALKYVDSEDKLAPEKKEITDKILKQLNYPWKKLFGTLEAIHTNDISLMSIQPNIDKQEVLITAEALNAHLMFEYIRALGKQKNIVHVELMTHEIISESSEQRLSFVVMLKFT